MNAIQDAVIWENGIEKSANDEREYKVIELENKLQVLLVSDVNTDKAAAGMSVNVGHFQDPEEIPGLAHFLEHMLFLGTEKFPDENEYGKYLNEHGGSSNAYTATEETNYYFDVAHQHLYGALERFSQFFIAPLFTATATSRELQAVDNEHSKNIQDDMWRFYQLEKTTSSPNHPYHKFATGDSKTLRDIPEESGIDVRSALLDFHKRYYSANRMKLVILGKESLDVLENWTREMFNGVKNTNAPELKYDGNEPFSKNECGRIFEIVPIKDLRTIDLSWHFGSLREKYKERPMEYLGNLLGHEGPGSILSYLKTQGWANSLSAGLSTACSDFSIFRVSIDCTEIGITKHVEDIVSIVFEYISMMKKEGVQEWFMEEVINQRACEFRFASSTQPITLVSRVANNMHYYPKEHILSGSALIRSIDVKSIQELINGLTPDRMQLAIAHKSMKPRAKLQETWYKTEYNMEKIESDRIEKWSSHSKSDKKVYLPKRNEFLPTDFEIRPFIPPKALKAKDLKIIPSQLLAMTLEETTTMTLPNMENTSLVDSLNQCTMKSVLESWDKNHDTLRPPVLVKATESMLLWFKQDTHFRRPKISATVMIKSLACYESATASCAADLYCSLVKDVLNEFAYNAEVAGLYYNIEASITGLELGLGGFGHKLHVLLKRIMESMTNVSAFSQDHFARFKEQLFQRFQNWDKEQPYNHSIYNVSYLINVPRWHIQEKLDVLQSLSLDTIKTFVQNLLQNLQLEIFIHGNLSQDEAENLASIIDQGLSKPMENSENSNRRAIYHSPVQRVVQLMDKSQSYYMLPGLDVANTNSAIESIFQIGIDNVKTSALVAILSQIAKEPFFNELRTKQQLGYIVHTSFRNDVGVLSIRFVVQSNSTDPFIMDSRIEDFIDYLGDLIHNKMDSKMFQSFINTVIASLLEKDKQLFTEARRWWNQIKKQTYHFSKSIDVAKQVAALTQGDVSTFFDDYLSKNGKYRRKLVAGIFGSPHLEFLPNNLIKTPGNPEIQLPEDGEKYMIQNPKAFKHSLPLYPVRSQVVFKL